MTLAGAALARDPVRACVALGANLGDPVQALQAALAALQAHPGIAQLRVSGFYRTAPVDATGPDFVNAVALLDTTLTAPALLDLLQAVEADAGRQRPYHHAPRTLDLDLLTYGTARIVSPRLTVPHPRMMDRAFVLVPLHDLAPERVPPAALAAVQHQVVERLR